MQSTFNTISGMVTGDRDAFDSMVRMSAATRT